MLYGRTLLHMTFLLVLQITFFKYLKRHIIVCLFLFQMLCHSISLKGETVVIPFIHVYILLPLTLRLPIF